MEVSKDIDLQTVVARSEKMLHSDIDGDVTMMSVENGKYYSLTSVGARIWTLLERPTAVSDLCDQLMREYRVDRTRCETEVLNLVRTMIEQGVAAPTTPAP